MKSIFILISFTLLTSFYCSGQTFSFSSNKNLKKDIKRKEKDLKKIENIDLPFPIDCVWLNDSIFISDFEVTLGSWGVDYGFKHDSSILKSADWNILSNYNVDSVYNTKNPQSYYELKKYSALLGSNYLFARKVERPLVFVDSLMIYNYITVLNNEVNKVISNPIDNWFWERFQEKKSHVQYSLMSIEDFTNAIKKYHGISPKIMCTDSIKTNCEIPKGKIEKYKGNQIIGLMDNASEIVTINNELHVIYMVTKETIYVTKFKNPAYHIGFRLKCKVIKNA